LFEAGFPLLLTLATLQSRAISAERRARLPLYKPNLIPIVVGLRVVPEYPDMRSIVRPGQPIFGRRARRKKYCSPFIIIMAHRKPKSQNITWRYFSSAVYFQQSMARTH